MDPGRCPHNPLPFPAEWLDAEQQQYSLGRSAQCALSYPRRELTEFRFVWLYILLSFLFYSPVTVLAGVIPALGMLMLPKTVCYILMLSAFLRFVFGKSTRPE